LFFRTNIMSGPNLTFSRTNLGNILYCNLGQARLYAQHYINSSKVDRNCKINWYSQSM
jgi:hypothetical protein